MKTFYTEYKYCLKHIFKKLQWVSLFDGHSLITDSFSQFSAIVRTQMPQTARSFSEGF